MSAGIFGKLPSHGDFVDRNLPAEFRNNWCEWLQHGLTVSREELGEQWLEQYLNCNSWRFALSQGVIDNNAWAGVIIPSVDSVGRYFPFTIVQSLSGNNIFSIINQDLWFEHIETIAISALDPLSSVQAIEQELKSLQPSLRNGFELTADKNTIKLSKNNNITDLSVTYLLSSSDKSGSTSIWHNSKTPENSFICKGMPLGSTFTKMLY